MVRDSDHMRAGTHAYHLPGFGKVILKNINLSGHTMKMAIFQEIQQITFDGNAQELLMSFTACVQKVLDSKISNPYHSQIPPQVRQHDMHEMQQPISLPVHLTYCRRHYLRWN